MPTILNKKKSKTKLDDKTVHNNDDKKCSQIMVIINVSLLACKQEK